MKQYRMFELTFSGAVLEDNWSQVDVTAVFSCGEESIALKGFYDGDGLYKVRFLPHTAGLWKWKVSGAVTASGEELCEANPEAHGIVKAEDTYFVHEDGTKYLPFGTTVYALTHQQDEIVEQTFATLAEAPFNKVRMCVFPKHYDLVQGEPPYHPYHMTENGKPDVRKPNIEFWHRFEGHLDRLEELGIQVDLILFHPYDCWGYSSMSQEDNLVYLDTVIRRLAARPNIWWSLANEYDLMTGWNLENWYEIEEFVARNDPYGHLLSNHNCTAAYDFTRQNITHACLQTRWIENAGNWIRQYGKPVVYDEISYEGNLTFMWGNISGLEMTHRFWTICANGAYATHGDTFMDENNIIWWACGGKLKGVSAPRIGFLKDILYSLPGALEPWPRKFIGDLVQFTDEELEEKAKKFPGMAVMVRGLKRMDPGMLHTLINSEIIASGHCGEDAYLTYYGRFCPYQGEMHLPKDKTYRVEVIDTWNMTREVVLENASGYTEVPLPSKEYVAVLAVANKN